MGEWIRTETRNPPEGMWLIVVVKTRKGLRKSCFGFHVAGKWFGIDDYPLAAPPEWWMPLPEPPEE